MLTSEQGTAQELGPVEVERRAPDLLIRNGAFALGLDTDGGATVAGSALRLAPGARGLVASPSGLEVTVETATLVRAVATGTLGTAVAYDITWDVHQTRNVHVYVRLRAREDVVLEDLALPALGTDAAAAGAGRDRWAALSIAIRAARRRREEAAVARELERRRRARPRRARRRGAGARRRARAPGSRAPRCCAPARPSRPRCSSGPAPTSRRSAHEADVRAPRGALHPRGRAPAHPRLGERRRSGSDRRSSTAARSARPTSSIPRRAGPRRPRAQALHVEQRGLRLWRLTGKDRYRESGVKKAYALLATQNEHGGWFEGIEFYNLPPRHHHMYDTYIARDVPARRLRRHRASRRSSTPRAAARDFWLGSRRPRTATPRRRPARGGTAGAATSTSSATPTSGGCSTPTRGRRPSSRCSHERTGDEAARGGAGGHRGVQAGAAARDPARRRPVPLLPEPDRPDARAAGRPAVHQARPRPADRGRLHRGLELPAHAGQPAVRRPGGRPPRSGARSTTGGPATAPARFTPTAPTPRSRSRSPPGRSTSATRSRCRRSCGTRAHDLDAAGHVGVRRAARAAAAARADRGRGSRASSSPSSCAGPRTSTSSRWSTSSTRSPISRCPSSCRPAPRAPASRSATRRTCPSARSTCGRARGRRRSPCRRSASSGSRSCPCGCGRRDGGRAPAGDRRGRDVPRPRSRARGARGRRRGAGRPQPAAPRRGARGARARRRAADRLLRVRRGGDRAACAAARSSASTASGSTAWTSRPPRAPGSSSRTRPATASTSWRSTRSRSCSPRPATSRSRTGRSARAPGTTRSGRRCDGCAGAGSPSSASAASGGGWPSARRASASTWWASTHSCPRRSSSPPASSPPRWRARCAAATSSRCTHRSPRRRTA